MFKWLLGHMKAKTGLSQHIDLPQPLRRNTVLLAAAGLIALQGLAVGADEAPQKGAPAGTQVVIIGTIHGEHLANKRYSPEMLRDMIKSAAPDVILVELPTDMVDPNGRSLCRDVRQCPENWAADSAATELGIRQIPFDQPDREQIFRQTRYFKRQEDLSRLRNEWNTMVMNRDPNSGDAKACLAFGAICEAQFDFMRHGRPEEINSDGFDHMIAAKHTLMYDVMPGIIGKYPGYEKIIPEQRFFSEHWQQRNRTMAANIIKVAGRFKGKRLVVLTGCEHRYVLRGLLKSERSIDVKEFWEVGT